MLIRFFTVVVCLISFNQVAVAQISNGDMYRALRLIESNLGKHPGLNTYFFADIPANNKLSKLEFRFQTAGQPYSNGEVDIYIQYTSVENKGTHIELNHLTRDIPGRIFGTVLNDEKFLEAVEKLSEIDNTRNTSLNRVDDKLLISTEFTGESLNSTFGSYFRGLNIFHGSLEGSVNRINRQFEEALEDTKFTSFSDMNLDVADQQMAMKSEDLILLVLDQPMAENERISENHWGWKGSHELVNKEDSFECVITIDVLDELSAEDKQALLETLRETADKNRPEGFATVRTSLQEGEDERARIAFIYDLSSGRKGKDIRKHYYEYSIEADEMREALVTAAREYNGAIESLVKLNVHDFAYEVTEFDLTAETSGEVDGTQGYWEFSQNDINYDIVNFGESMMLSFTLELSDAWTVEEIEENNELFTSRFDSDDVLNADKFYTTSYYDDDYTVWVVLEFEYMTRTTEELKKIYEKFMDKTSKELYKALLEDQGVAQ